MRIQFLIILMLPFTSAFSNNPLFKKEVINLTSDEKRVYEKVKSLDTAKRTKLVKINKEAIKKKEISVITLDDQTLTFIKKEDDNDRLWTGKNGDYDFINVIQRGDKVSGLFVHGTKYYSFSPVSEDVYVIKEIEDNVRCGLDLQ